MYSWVKVTAWSKVTAMLKYIMTIECSLYCKTGKMFSLCKVTLAVKISTVQLGACGSSPSRKDRCNGTSNIMDSK